MFKKILAASVSVALLIAAAVIFFPKKTDDGTSLPKEEGLTIGVGKLTGGASPFFEPSEGDVTVRDLVLAKMVCSGHDTENDASADVPSIAESREIFFTDNGFNRTEKFEEGGYTAVTFVLKNGLVFSDGEPDYPGRRSLFSVHRSRSSRRVRHERSRYPRRSRRLCTRDRGVFRGEQNG